MARTARPHAPVGFVFALSNHAAGGGSGIPLKLGSFRQIRCQLPGSQIGFVSANLNSDCDVGKQWSGLLTSPGAIGFYPNDNSNC
jgi:hypothetical protein